MIKYSTGWRSKPTIISYLLLHRKIRSVAKKILPSLNSIYDSILQSEGPEQNSSPGAIPLLENCSTIIDTRYKPKYIGLSICLFKVFQEKKKKKIFLYITFPAQFHYSLIEIVPIFFFKSTYAKFFSCLNSSREWIKKKGRKRSRDVLYTNKRVTELVFFLTNGFFFIAYLDCIIVYLNNVGSCFNFNLFGPFVF